MSDLLLWIVLTYYCSRYQLKCLFILNYFTTLLSRALLILIFMLQCRMQLLEQLLSDVSSYLIVGNLVLVSACALFTAIVTDLKVPSSPAL